MAFTLEALLHEHPLEAFCNLINDKFLYDLNPFTTIITDIVDLDGEHVEIYIDRKISNRSSNQLKDLSVDSFILRRLDLGYISNNTVIDFTVETLPQSAFELLETYCKDKNIILTRDDIEDIDLLEYDKSYTIKANEKSLRFRGTIEITLNKIPVALNNLSICYLPDVQTLDNKNSLAHYNGTACTMWINFTAEREILRQVGLKDDFPSAKELASIISKYSPFNFVATNYLRQSNITNYLDSNGVPRYKVLFHGSTIDSPYVTRNDLENVLILELNPSFCNNIMGRLFLHYN